MLTYSSSVLLGCICIHSFANQLMRHHVLLKRSPSHNVSSQWHCSTLGAAHS
jgi:hypothetical protein